MMFTVGIFLEFTIRDPYSWKEALASLGFKEILMVLKQIFSKDTYSTHFNPKDTLCRAFTSNKRMGKTPNSLTTNRSRAVTVKSELEAWRPPDATEQPLPSSPTHHRRHFCGPSSNAAEHNMEIPDLVHCPLSPMEESSHCLNCKRQGPHCFTGILPYL